jgi:hypothetical protein
MNKRHASAAALALVLGLASSPVLADAGFVAIQQDLLGAAPLPTDVVDVNDGDGITSGEVGDFVNTIPQVEITALERRCDSAVALPGQHLAASVAFCREYLSTLDEIGLGDMQNNNDEDEAQAE